MVMHVRPLFTELRFGSVLCSYRETKTHTIQKIVKVKILSCKYAEKEVCLIWKVLSIDNHVRWYNQDFFLCNPICQF